MWLSYRSFIAKYGTRPQAGPLWRSGCRTAALYEDDVSSHLLGCFLPFRKKSAQAAARQN